MDKTRTPMTGYAVLMVSAAALVAFVLQAGKRDVAFCQALFEDLASGKPSAQKRIDWEHLQALDVNVGATYASLPNEQERAKYRQAFVDSFSKGFRGAQGRVGAFTRWRIHERADDQVVVAADYAGKDKTLLLAVPASGNKRLEGIQWQ
jgi:hypothetical protein